MIFIFPIQTTSPKAISKGGPEEPCSDQAYDNLSSDIDDIQTFALQEVAKEARVEAAAAVFSASYFAGYLDKGRSAGLGVASAVDQVRAGWALDAAQLDVDRNPDCTGESLKAAFLCGWNDGVDGSAAVDPSDFDVAVQR